MSISSNVKTFTGPFSGGDGSFSLGFPAEGAHQITVWRYNDLEGLRQELSYEAGDFSATFNPASTNGTYGAITIEDSRGVDVEGDYFIIASVLPEEQSAVFAQYGRFNPEVHEKAMDKIVLQLKQLRRDLERVFVPSSDPQGPVVINADTINISGMEWMDYLIQAQADARNSANQALDAKNSAELALVSFQKKYLGEFLDESEFPVSPDVGSMLFFHGGAFGPIGLYTYFGAGFVDKDTGTPWVLAARKGDKGDQGAKGDRGTDAVQLTWLGGLMDYPAEPVHLNVFHHLLERVTYMYDGETSDWVVLTVDGAKGDKGDKGDTGVLRWRGDLYGTEPNDPEFLDIYRDSNTGELFFYDGSAWVLWVVDGAKGDTGEKGDPMQIDAMGTLSNRDLYDSEDAGFVYFADDVEMIPSAPPDEDVFIADGGPYELSFTPRGEQSVVVYVNNVIQTSRAYSFTITGGTYELNISATNGDEIVVRELTAASGKGALFIKRAGAGVWSEPLSLSQGPQGLRGLRGLDGRAGDRGPKGDTLIWKGELVTAPVDPQDFWAYRDTTSKTLRFYMDGRWWDWAADGARGASGIDGLNATEITWLGDWPSENLPSTPALFTLLRHTFQSPNRLMFWDGAQWNEWVRDGTNGTNGQNGAPARNFLWRGELTEDPVAAAAGRGGSMELDIYRNTDTKKIRCYIDGQWRDWSIDGAQGPQGPQGPKMSEPDNVSGSTKNYLRRVDADNTTRQWVDLSDVKASQYQFGVAKIWVAGGVLYINTV